MEEFRAAVISALTALGGFFVPIVDFVIAILVLLCVNFISGWIEDALHADGWKWNKAFKTLYECAVLAGIGAFTFVMGHFMHKEGAALQCLGVIYMAATWFFSVNILNNWKKILPEGTTLHSFICFLYFIIALQFVTKIPYLKAFLLKRKDEESPDIKEVIEELTKEDK